MSNTGPRYNRQRVPTTRFQENNFIIALGTSNALIQLMKGRTWVRMRIVSRDSACGGRNKTFLSSGGIHFF